MKGLKRILAAEGLVASSLLRPDGRGSYVYETEQGTYSYLDGEGIIFDPTRPYLHILDHKEKRLTTLQEAEAWIAQHQSQNAGVAPHPADPLLALKREGAQKAAVGMQRIFRRKPTVEELTQRSKTQIGVRVSLRLPESEELIQKNLAAMGKALGIQFQGSRIVEVAPMEYEHRATGQLGSVKVHFTQATMRGRIFMASVVFF